MHGVSAPPAFAPVSSNSNSKSKSKFNSNSNSNPRCRVLNRNQSKTPALKPNNSSSIQGGGGGGGGYCWHCRRRSLLGASLSALLPLQFHHPFPVSAAPPTDPTAAIEMVHPSRSDWYDELFATAMSTGMKAYETEIAGYKQKLFSNLTSTANKVLELGVGAGPNFKYYANNTALTITAVDPNKQMEKYARSSAATAGLPPSNLNFIRGVGEALPVEDDSMDAVIGTLVLCSVKDVDATLREVKRVLKPDGQYIFIEHIAAQDGTFLRFVQGALDPLQQTFADGCHLTRETGKQIEGVGFSQLSLNNAFLKSLSFLGPHIYGVACK